MKITIIKTYEIISPCKKSILSQEIEKYIDSYDWKRIIKLLKKNKKNEVLRIIREALYQSNVDYDEINYLKIFSFVKDLSIKQQNDVKINKLG